MSELAPGILIAAPPLGDPNFDRSVVFLASHDRDGAFGWIINGNRILTVGELLSQAGFADEDGVSRAGYDKAVSRGGPVCAEQVWMVYPTLQKIEGLQGQLEIAPGITATASRDFLELLAQGASVPGLRAFAGYAGWGPGQLEREIQHGAWLPGDITTDLLFSTETGEVWSRAYELQGMTPIAFTTRTVGEA